MTPLSERMNSMEPRIISSQTIPCWFGDLKLDEFQTRFGTIEWIVTESSSENGLRETIGQCTTKAEALAVIGSALLRK